MMRFVLLAPERPFLQTSARDEGKHVEVYGIPYYSAPSPGPENYVHLLCIAPVYEIRVLDDAPEESGPPGAADLSG
ncbi:hypothetical protein [Nannocystis sp. SCPEA4]|uniref:hypothetical protein n=1 Tax=Nannocystis sp. SCPEA4 TaxID=2996787 RepID=UPI002271AD71|nr:hypothetical protein [Nannocystis sp. SCPEA4]MCY1061838.1 hypothetical protein [Nannocystis sp. SCPEA4]